MAIRYKDDIIVMMHLMFPDDEMLGIDLVIPDITYLKENKKHIRVSLHGRIILADSHIFYGNQCSNLRH